MGLAMPRVKNSKHTFCERSKDFGAGMIMRLDQQR
jgi:hypothetical protein